MTKFVMSDVVGIWQSPLPASGTLSRIFQDIWLDFEGHPFFVSDRNGDPMVVSFMDDEEDWAWDVYWNEGL